MTTLVGSSGNAADSAHGAVDDLGMWTRPLSPKDLQAIYQSGLNGVPLPQAVLSGPLTISYSATSTGLTLTYPAWAKDYVLETSPSLQSGSWTATGLTPQIVGENAVQTIAFAPGNKFFRLRQ